MKYLSTILLTFITSCLLAQNPTYDQTVSFIKTNVVGRVLYEGTLDSYKRETGHKLTKIEIQKDGRIKLVADQQNGRHDFEIVFNIFDLKSSIDYPDGIRAYKFLVHFQGLNVSSGYGITFATDADAKRVARAFRHLKTMCSKGGGLFDEPTQTEEKPTLTKVETLNYIENLLKKQSEISDNWDNSRDNGKINLVQQFNSSTGSFNKYITVINKDYMGYSYEESETYFSNIMQAPIENISILAPNSEKKDFNKKFYCIKIYFSFPIQYTYKRHRNYVDDYDRLAQTLSEAKKDCKSEPWERSNEENRIVKIFIKNETDSRRLKKAFLHLAALIKEEKNLEKENDPFGN